MKMQVAKNCVKKVFCAVSFFVFFCSLLLAQSNITVKGKVIDGRTKEELPGVVILQKGTQNGGGDNRCFRSNCHLMNQLTGSSCSSLF